MPPPSPVVLTGVTGLPEVGAGADLAALIAGAADVVDGDVVVVTSKVVS
jgi:coenzyme F420-0:L-glutamate ligase/coenzyme F420-1:gamma-L-glutamate ligase